MTDGKARAAEPSLFQGLASSPAREATRRATRRFCKLLQPARERENWPVYLDTRRVRSKPSRLLPGAFESPTNTIISSCTGYNGTRGGSRAIMYIAYSLISVLIQICTTHNSTPLIKVHSNCERADIVVSKG